MKDFGKYKDELEFSTKSFNVDDCLKYYALPNSEEIHNMICNYSENFLGDDVQVFETAHNLDFLKYEKELCKLNKQN